MIRVFAYAGFFLIIISFVFFYGWDSSVSQGSGDAPIARVRASVLLSFLPWRKWELIDPAEVPGARKRSAA